MQDVGKKRPLGEGRRQLPWYWRITLPDTDEDSASDADVQNEFDMALRVEWFQSRERYRRWNEEIHWLQREAASLVLHFNCLANRWKVKADTSQNPAWCAYGLKQHALFSALQHNAYKTLQPILV
ncbi:hypothetical protein FRC08_017066, partial [Ceratobasidium sp. 394]